jgi:hypothetical protein
MCCDFDEGECGHMAKKNCFFCKGNATRTTYWGSPGNRYEVASCEKCVISAAASDRKWANLRAGFAEYNRYCDSKGR